MNNTNFLHHYVEIFNIPEFKKQLHKIRTVIIKTEVLDRLMIEYLLVRSKD